MSNSLFSKEMQDQLKELKGQLSKGRDTNSPEGENQKPTEPVSLPTQKQVKKTVKQLDSEHIDDDKVLFMQAMHGVNQLEDKNVRSPASATRAGKPDAATLSKRAAAQGSEASDLGAGLSDMQALLNPVAAEAYLSYKQPTLQNKIFDQLKKGKLRWYDAVDIHGCTIEEAREAMTQLLSQAKQNNESLGAKMQNRRFIEILTEQEPPVVLVGPANLSSSRVVSLDRRVSGDGGQWMLL